MRLLVIAVALSSSAGLAQRQGDALRVVTRDAALFKEPSARAKKLHTLQAGEEVRWLGPSEKDRRFHLVQARGTTGYVPLTSVAPGRITPEYDASTGKPMSAQAFASSGRGANKDEGMGSSAPKDTPTTRELSRMSELNRNTATPAALEQKRSELSK